MAHLPTLPPTSSTQALCSDWLTLDGFNRMMRTDDAAASFARKVYGYLERMRPGRACTFVRYGMPQLEWCIRTTAAFILEGMHWKEYSLSDDCLTVRRDGATDVPERMGARRARSSNFKRPHPGMHVGLNTTFG